MKSVTSSMQLQSNVFNWLNGSSKLVHKRCHKRQNNEQKMGKWKRAKKKKRVYINAHCSSLIKNAMHVDHSMRQIFYFILFLSARVSLTHRPQRWTTRFNVALTMDIIIVFCCLSIKPVVICSRANYYTITYHHKRQQYKYASA